MSLSLIHLLMPCFSFKRAFHSKELSVQFLKIIPFQLNPPYKQNQLIVAFDSVQNKQRAKDLNQPLNINPLTLLYTQSAKIKLHMSTTNQQPKPFSIKCECSAYRDHLLITNKKKSKLSNLVLNPKTKTIHIVPLHSKDEDYVFELKKLKHIHKKFLSEGKITIEFTEEMQKIKEGGKLVEGASSDRLSQIFVEAASPQNLQLMIKKIIQLKSSMKAQTKSQPKPKPLVQKDLKTLDQIPQVKAKPSITVNKKKQEYPKLQKYEQNLAERKKDPLKYNQSIKKYEEENDRIPRVSRKQLMREAYRGELIEIDYEKKPQVKTIFRPQIDLLTMPQQLLKKIFEYTKLELRQRLVNKGFDRFVLRNIKGLNFMDDVDQETFNKLAKYVPNIRGRLKNVRNLELIDLYDQPELEKNRARSLYLGEWKQMSKKSILQIKGLRIHTLEMPYQIKFDFWQIRGIRLRQLHLTSKYPVTTANSMITDQNLIYLLKHVLQLQSLSIPYVNSGVLQQLTTNLKEKTLKMRELRIGSLNENCKKQEKWFLFHTYENLRCLKVERVLKGGILKKGCNYTFTFPMYIEELEVGSIVSQDTIKKLPTTLTYLKLEGQQYYNSDIANIFLPYLRCFDISQCPLVRPSVINDLEKCNRLKMITNWDKQDFDYWKDMAQEKDIQVISLKGMIRR